MHTRQVLLAGASTGLVLAASLAGVSPASAQSSVRATTRYSSCAKLNTVYPHGVGLRKAHDHTSSGRNPVTTFTRNDRVYKANTARDRDKDGVACEKH